MKNHKPLILFSALLLVGLSIAAPSSIAQTIENGCMEEVAQFGLGCTANDVLIAGVATDPDTGEPLLEILDDGCAFPGDTVTFSATFEVVLNAQARHDIGIYFATDGDSNNDGAITGACTISTIPFGPDPPFLDLDGFEDGGFCELSPTTPCEADRHCRAFGGACKFEQDVCGDIDDDHNPLFPVITITTECIDPDGNQTLNLPNCTSWRQPGANDLCTGPLGAFPGSPSKCRCDLGFEVPILVPAAELTVTKTADTNSVEEPGANVEFFIEVVNQSPFATFTLNSLNDSIYGDIADPANPLLISTTCDLPQVLPSEDATPGGGDTYSCSFIAFVGGQPGFETNVVTASGTDENDNVVDGTDDETVEITDVTVIQGLSIVKSVTSASSLPEPGGDFDFKVIVTNLSTVDDVEVTDLDDTFLADLQTNGLCSDADADTTAPWTLSPDEALTCTFTVSHTGQPATFDNSVAVAAVDDDDRDVGGVSNTVQVAITAVDAVPLSIVKSVTSASSLPEPGGDFAFMVVITNNSTVDTATVTDLDDTYLADLQTSGSCLDGDGDSAAPYELSPGEALTCTFTVSHTGQPATFDNNVTVAATDDDGSNVGGVSNTVMVEITDVAAVPLSIVKSVTSASSLPEPGGDFEFQVVITNNSTVDTATVTDLDDTYLADLQTSGSCLDGDGVSAAPYELSPGEALTCTFTVSHTGQPATFDDNVTVAASDDEGADVGGVSNTVTVEITDVEAVPLSILKSVTSASSLPEPGGDFEFQVVITNNSTVDTATVTDLDDTYLADLQTSGSCSDADADTTAPWTLSPGEALTCTFTVSHTGQPATFDNNVTVAASDDEGADVGGVSNTVTVEITDVEAVPLSIVKSVTSASSLPEPGGDFEFMVVVTNNSTIDTATVTDLDDTFLADLQTSGSCSDADADTTAPWTLSPGEALTCTFTVSHTGQPATFDNNVTVAATDDDGSNVGGVSNTVQVAITDVAPAASLTKTATMAAVTYQVVVTNESTAEALTLTALMDDKFFDVTTTGHDGVVSTTCSVPQTLEKKGESGDVYTCSFVANVNAADTPHTNTLTGTVTDNDEPTIVTPSDSATVDMN